MLDETHERLQRKIAAINAERTIDLNRYREDGCDSRYAYLEGLAEIHGVGVRDVVDLAGFLGPNEDFDGLVTMLEDHASELQGAG